MDPDSDPDHDPAFFVSDIQDVKMFFCLFTSFFKDKRSQRSHKTEGINVFLTIFA